MDAWREIQREVDACSCERGRQSLAKWMTYARLINASDPYLHHNAMLYSGMRGDEFEELGDDMDYLDQF